MTERKYVLPTAATIREPRCGWCGQSGLPLRPAVATCPEHGIVREASACDTCIDYGPPGRHVHSIGMCSLDVVVAAARTETGGAP